VTVKAIDPTRVEPLMEVAAEDAVLAPSQPVRLSVKARCTGPEAWPCRLVVEVRTGQGRVIDRQACAVQLSAKEWYREERSVQSAPSPCAIVFRLEYEGAGLLERAVHVEPAYGRSARFKVANGGLVNDSGERVLLRLSEDVANPPLRGFEEQLRNSEKKRVTVCVVDDSLAPEGEAEQETYYGVLRQMILKKFPDQRVTLRRLRGEYVSHHDPLTRLGEIPAQAAEESPDLVIVAGSMRDLAAGVPPPRYERYLFALVDRLRGATDAEILLVTPPPIIVNPGLSKQYAQKTIRVALRRGLKVADAYSAFTRRGEERAWQDYFRDISEPDVLYLQPNRDGQRLIAERIMDALLGS